MRAPTLGDMKTDFDESLVSSLSDEIRDLKAKKLGSFSGGEATRRLENGQYRIRAAARPP